MPTTPDPLDNPELAVLVAAIRASVQPWELEPDLWVTRSDSGLDKVIDTQEWRERWSATPHRATGTALLTNPESFVAYVKALATPATRLYVDSDGVMTAVFNDHTVAEPGHRDHRAQLRVEWTPEWVAWMTLSGELLEQDAFADFVDDHAAEFIDPDAATMLEIAQSFQATVGAELRSARRLTDGQVQFLYAEDISAAAGQQGDIAIPQTLRVAVVPYEGADPVELTARFRFRVRPGKVPALGFKVDRLPDVRRALIAGIAARVADDLALTAHHGRPAA